MTDLERVRDDIDSLYHWTDRNVTIAQEVRKRIFAALDAHLKEDEERDALMVRMDTNLDFAKLYDEASAELTELREKNTRLNYELAVTDYPGKNDLVRELAALRAVGEDILVHGENIENRARLRQLIKEKP